MVECELFQLETAAIPVEDAPTLEDNKANEEGILYFLAGVDEYKTQTPLHTGDMILEEDHEEEIRRTPCRVLHEFYGNDGRCRGLRNYCFRMSHPHRVPPSSYSLIAYRAGDLRDIYHDREIRKSREEKQAAMERLEVIKNAKGPILRSQLVTGVCEAFLASGSVKGYTFSNAADAPSASSAPKW